jgi:hypothetical protein
MVWDYQFRLENVYDQGKSPREKWTKIKHTERQTKEKRKSRPKRRHVIVHAKFCTPKHVPTRPSVGSEEENHRPSQTNKQAKRNECGQLDNPDSDTECTPAPHQKAGRGAQRWMGSITSPVSDLSSSPPQGTGSPALPGSFLPHRHPPPTPPPPATARAPSSGDPASGPPNGGQSFPAVRHPP